MHLLSGQVYINLHQGNRFESIITRNADPPGYAGTLRHRPRHRYVKLCHRIADELSLRQEPELVTNRVFRMVTEHTNAAIDILSFRSRPDGILKVIRIHDLPDDKSGDRLALCYLTAAWAAARRAMGTRNGEHET